MEVTVVPKDKTVLYRISPKRFIEVYFYSPYEGLGMPRILAYGLNHENKRIPCSLYQDEVNDFIEDARQRLEGQALPANPKPLDS